MKFQQPPLFVTAYRASRLLAILLTSAVLCGKEACAAISASRTSPVHDGSDPWDIGSAPLSIGSAFEGPGFLGINGGSEVLVGSVSTAGQISVSGVDSALQVRDLLAVGNPLDLSALSISSGGSVRSGAGRLFASATATVTGDDSLWRVASDLRVGFDSPTLGETAGTLNVLDNGAASVAGVFSIDSLGVVNVNGGSLNADGGLDNTAGGTLNWFDGTIGIGGGSFQPAPLAASGEDANFTIDSATASGLSRLVLRDNATADWSHLPFGAALRVGNAHRGRLEITSGATLLNPLSLIAARTGSDGTALVTGDGSAWTTNAMRVGQGGVLTVTDMGTVTVNANPAIDTSFVLDDGGTITLNGGSIHALGGLDNSAGGALSLQDGTLTVENGVYRHTSGGDVFRLFSAGNNPHLVIGAGATTENIDQLSIGVFSDAQLTVKDGGQLSAQQILGGGTIRVENGGGVLLEDFTTTVAGTGMIVSGAGSTWIQGGDFNLAQAGLTLLLIQEGGGVFNANAVLGVGAGATAGVVVTGDDSRWHSAGDLSVGEAGRGFLTIGQGGLVSVGGILSTDNARGDGGSSVDIAVGGMLALLGDADDSLSVFLDLIEGTDAIRYWDSSIADWADIAGATLGEDYALEFLTTGDLAGYTKLTILSIPEPAAAVFVLLGSAGICLLCRRATFLA